MRGKNTNNFATTTGEGLTQQSPANCPQLAEGYTGPCHKGHSRCVRAARRMQARGRERQRDQASRMQEGGDRARGGEETREGETR